MICTPPLDAMTASALQQRYGVSSAMWDLLESDPHRPEPKCTEPEQAWNPEEIGRWLARHHPYFTRRVPFLLRRPTEAAQQFAALSQRSPVANPVIDASSDLPHRSWLTSELVITLIYQDGGLGALDRAMTAATPALVAAADVLLVPAPTPDAPGLLAVDRERPDVVYRAKWSELAELVGSSVPQEVETARELPHQHRDPRNEGASGEC